MVAATDLFLSSYEYERLIAFLRKHTSDDFQPLIPVHSRHPKRAQQAIPYHNLASFRAATRVYIGVNGSLKLLDILLHHISSYRRSTIDPTPPTRKPLVGSRHRLALSLATLLFAHRYLYRLTRTIRQNLLEDYTKPIRQRWPILSRLLTSKYLPALLASLSGFALSISPADQLRTTISIYVFVRSLELSYTAADIAGYLKHKPRWLGSWILFAVSYAQLFSTTITNPDCAPPSIQNLITNHSKTYLRPRQATLPSRTPYPSPREQLDILATLPHLSPAWPKYISPLLRPDASPTSLLPSSPLLSPSILSKLHVATASAHPLTTSLSCALLHSNPTTSSCLPPALAQYPASFLSLLRTFTIYYSAFSLLRLRSLFTSPTKFLDTLSRKILRVTAVAAGSISGSWAGICLLNSLLKGHVLAKQRFLLAGLLGSLSVSWLDRTRETGHENAMYMVRMSLLSSWRVGVEKGWWKSKRGADVWLFVVSLGLFNLLYDVQREGVGKERSMLLVRLLRGDIEVGLRKHRSEEREEKDK